MTDTRIMLASGALFDLLDPAASAFTLHDIAHGLGRVCRFAGHTNRFYSVAEHCVHVARIVPVELGRAALLHDASEAFIGDVTRPLKALLPDYQRIENNIEDAIARRFLPGFDGNAFKAPAIKAADMAMCMVEARALMPEVSYEGGGGFWLNQKTDVKAKYPAVWDQAKRDRLECDKPEFATVAWLRAWHRYGHWQAQLQADKLDPPCQHRDCDGRPFGSTGYCVAHAGTIRPGERQEAA
jgi:hypothetical protein